MNTRLVLPLALALTGCPTPPESGAGAGAGGAAPPPPIAGGTAGAPGPVENPGDVNGEARTGTFTVNELPPELNNAPNDGKSTSPEESQQAIKEGDHVIFAGEVLCADCSGKLLVTVAPFVQPDSGDGTAEKAVGDGGGPSNFEFPPVVLDGSGPFSFAVPTYDGQVVIEVLDDLDGNGMPSQGEKFTVLHNQGKITAPKNQSGLKVDFSQLPSAPSMPDGGPGGPPPVGSAPPNPPQ